MYATKINNEKTESLPHEKQQAMLNTNLELLSLKIKMLRTQMNPHFVFNALNAIQYFITINDKRLSLIYLSTFSKLIRYHLNYIDKDEVTIETELKMLKWYLKLQKLRYEEKLEFSFNSNIDNLHIFKRIPSMVLASVIESIVENGVLNQKETTKVNIKLRVENNMLIFNIVFNSKKEKKKKNLNYRDELISWEGQINLLNKLKNLNIEKRIEKVALNSGKESEVNITIGLPIF